MPVPAGGDDSTLYSTLAKLRARLDRSDSVRDSELTDALTAASRQVDEDTGRRFYIDAAATARTYSLSGRVAPRDDGEILLVDDIASTTSLVIEVGGPGSWSALTLDEDVLTEPDNAASAGHAITGLLRYRGSWGSTGSSRVRITAYWGWPAVPAQIEAATLLRAHRIYRRRNSPEGVAGMGDAGVVRVGRYDPDYDALIRPYVLDGFG